MPHIIFVKSGKPGTRHNLPVYLRDRHGYFRIGAQAQLYNITHTDILRAVITDPDHPKFDLEALLLQVQKDSA